MKQSIACVFCGVRLDAPAAVCPHCGGPVADAGLDRAGSLAPGYPANDDALALPEADGELVIMPVGVDDATLFGAAPPKPRPPPLPKKKIARA